MASASEHAAAHLAAFNDAVDSGAWEEFARRFGADAEMSFVGVPAGPFTGREAIAAAYAADPPGEGLDPGGDPVVEGDDVVVPFRWRESGGTGSMRLRFDDTGLVTRLVVAFGPPVRG